MKLSNTFDFPSKYPFTLTNLPKVDGGTREIDLNRVCFKIQTYKHLLKGNGLIKGQITKLFILSPFRIMKQPVPVLDSGDTVIHYTYYSPLSHGACSLVGNIDIKAVKKHLFTVVMKAVRKSHRNYENV